MAQWVKRVATQPNDLSSTPRIHLLEGGNHSQKLSSDLQTHTHTLPLYFSLSPSLHSNIYLLYYMHRHIL